MSQKYNSPLLKLTEKESKIFQLLVAGNKTSEISKRLSLSYKEVAEHSKEIKAKLNAKSIDALVQVAIQSRILLDK